MIKCESQSPDSFFFPEQAVVDFSSLAVDAEYCAQSDRNADNCETAIHTGQLFFVDESSDNPNNNVTDIRYSEKPAKIRVHSDNESGKHKSFHLDRVTPSSIISRRFISRRFNWKLVNAGISSTTRH